MKKISPHKLYEMSLDNNGVCNRDKYIELMIKEGWVIRKQHKCVDCGKEATLKQGDDWVCQNHVRFGLTLGGGLISNPPSNEDENG